MSRPKPALLRMPFRKASFPVICMVACLAAQSCVEYLPPPDNGPPGPGGPPPQPPPYPSQVPDQPPPPPSPPPYPAAPAYAPAPPNPNAALDSLLGPIALYPDPLVALILPASTVPADISSAASYLVQFGDPSRIDNQPWDPSVRALAHYPTVITWLAQNLDWTQALGSAFSASPAAVMDAIQRLRARAAAAGTLVSTSEQQVMNDEGEIEIVPSDPTTIYVPEYDPDVVYSVEPYYGMGSPIVFGPPCSAGIWLSYSFDWRSHAVWAGTRQEGGWHEARASAGHPPPGSHSWHPPASAPALPARPRENVAPPRPQPMPGTPRPPLYHYNNPAQDHAAPAPPSTRTGPPPMDRPRLNGTPAPAVPAAPTHASGLAPVVPERGAPPRYSTPPAGSPAPARLPPERTERPRCRPNPPGSAKLPLPTPRLRRHQRRWHPRPIPGATDLEPSDLLGRRLHRHCVRRKPRRGGPARVLARGCAPPAHRERKRTIGNRVFCADRYCIR
jgi:hypothetical protein